MVNIPSQIVPSSYVDTAGIAAVLHTTPGVIYNLRCEGRLPHAHRGRRLMYDPMEVLEWLKKGGDEVVGKFQCPVCQVRRTRHAGN